jgi:hypothetical protein
LLKKEIVQVQQLTDTIVKEKENENKQIKKELASKIHELEKYKNY